MAPPYVETVSGQHLEGNTEAKQSFPTCFRTNKALNKQFLLVIRPGSKGMQTPTQSSEMCEGRGQQNIGYMPDEGCKGKTWVCQDREIPNEANPTGSQGASQKKQLSRTRNQHWEALRSSLWMVSERELQSTGPQPCVDSGSSFSSC